MAASCPKHKWNLPGLLNAKSGTDKCHFLCFLLVKARYRADSLRGEIDLISRWVEGHCLWRTVQEGSHFFTSSPTFVVSCLVNFPHSHWCEVGSHCGFDLYFPDGQWCGAFSHVLVGHVYVFLCEISVHVFCPFHDWIVCFFAVELSKFFIDLGN